MQLVVILQRNSGSEFIFLFNLKVSPAVLICICCRSSWLWIEVHLLRIFTWVSGDWRNRFKCRKILLLDSVYQDADTLMGGGGGGGVVE